MKLFNIFKKETKNIINSNIQKLEKNQLSKVIGGTDLITIKSDVKVSASQNSQTL
jgi:hypothetical protein